MQLNQHYMMYVCVYIYIIYVYIYIYTIQWVEETPHQLVDGLCHYFFIPRYLHCFM